MRFSLLSLTTGALLAATGAQAQDSAAPTTGTPPTAQAPAAPSASAQSFTEADLKAFARAAIAASKIQQDAAVPATDKQPKMLAAVQAAGLDPTKFNEIAQASQSDPALQQRIQAAAQSEAQTAPAAPAAPAPAPAPTP
jgi:hypothetical protein